VSPLAAGGDSGAGPSGGIPVPEPEAGGAQRAGSAVGARRLAEPVAVVREEQPVERPAGTQTMTAESPGRAVPWAVEPAESGSPGFEPAGPYPRPGRPQPDRRPRRQLLGAGAGALAVLAVVAALLLPFLLGRDDSTQPAPQAEPTAGNPQPTATTPSPEAAVPPPAGYQLYKDPVGWSLAVPVGWTASRKGTSVSFTSGDRILRITARGNPPGDPYDAALKLEPVVKAATPGYDLMRIARVAYRGWPTADWEYRAGTSTKTHSLNRSIVPNPLRVYYISCTTEDRSWKAERTFFDTAAKTFNPGS
jgi:hypothetical protein